MHRFSTTPFKRPWGYLAVFSLFFVITVVFVFPSLVSAQGWSPEIQIPGNPARTQIEFVAYINSIYKFVSLIIGALGAVMFIIGGFQYLLSAGNTAAAGEAKRTMFAALAGIVIVLTAFFLLKIINKELVDLQVTPISSAYSNLHLL